MQTLDELNALTPEEFVAALDGVFEHAPWVAARVAGLRPFPTVAALHERMIEAVRAAPEAVRLLFLRGHPALSPKSLTDPGLTAASRVEQDGLGMAGLGAALAQFDADSVAYEQRFGFPFIICVRRQTPRFVLQALSRRLQNDAAAEREAALIEISFITRLRLKDRIDGPGMPATSGHLSAHVLDTVRGQAAQGVRIAVLREGVAIAEAITNNDGRTDAPLISGEPLRIGRYELRFHVADYFAGYPGVTAPPWYDVIPVRFGVAEPEGRYHIPLLLGTWSYTTYRGT